MIANIIDNRARQYRWKRINAAAEPTWHDNKCPDSDQVEPNLDEPDYEEKTGISVNEAVKWADALPYLVTLYLSEVK